MKKIIVAYDRNNGIGAANDLLWKNDLPADLRHFKDVTTGSAIIMGRKTYDSIGRPLPHRQNIVITRDDINIPNVTVVRSLEEAYQVATSPDIYVIGGGQIYELSIDTVDQILATEVQATFAADVFFPVVNPAVWDETDREHHNKDTDNKYDYDFVTYTRR